jgi:hypothetical protein
MHSTAKEVNTLSGKRGKLSFKCPKALQEKTQRLLPGGARAYAEGSDGIWMTSFRP